MSDSFKSSLRHNQTPDDQWIQSSDDLKCFIDSTIESKERRVGENRIKLNGSRGVWRCDVKLVEVIQNKNINGWMGSTIDSIKYLKPFEALYLMESQSMEVLFDGIPLSIEQSFQLFIENESEMDFYLIYGLLSRNGYFVKRHEEYDKNWQNNESVSQLNSKRKLSDCDIDCNKHLALNTNCYELSERIANYKSMINIRDLKHHLLPKTLISKTTDKCNQNECKETKCVSKQSIIYEIKDNESVVELNSSLTLFNGNVKPLCDLGSVLSSNDLFSLMQTFGPKQRQYRLSSESKFDLILDVFRQSDNKLEENPCFHVIVIKANQTIPQIDQIIDLQQKCRSKQLLFAVMNSNDINFYSFSTLNLNEEFPLLWQKYLKPIDRHF